ncbi:hypothetical protein JP0079_12220 [Helicobacter pylori]|uniref:hypothetical protein n=1 Tax=Helicobacter pylori TaxID=210 RepID=UPI001AAAF5A8|nr:hypothetical protein [Helicobacter pylori]GHQ49043.1 hypothetical protein JP0069_06810 [Helicobacter pylori]GHQ87520.1 hypothetical protein JP0079_12220 [Helicobacter pylori]
MPYSFKKHFLIIYALSTLLLVGVLLALFFFYAKNNLLENTQIRMQYTADAIAKSLLELDNASSLEPLKILEERFKNTPFVLLDADNKVKFSNIGAFVASFKNDAIKTPYFAFKKQGFYLTDSTPTNRLGVSKIIIAEEEIQKNFIPLYKMIGYVFLGTSLFVVLIARWLYKIQSN